MLYLLLVLIVIQAIHFVSHYRAMRLASKMNTANETFMRNLQQWVVSNDQSVLQSLGQMGDLVHSLYVRTRMIDLLLRNNINGDKQDQSKQLQELESLLNKEQGSSSLLNAARHKDAIERVRSEDIHYYYSSLLEELQQLNKQIGAVNTPPARSEGLSPVDGWLNRASRG